MRIKILNYFVDRKSLKDKYYIEIYVRRVNIEKALSLSWIDNFSKGNTKVSVEKQQI